MVFTSEPVVIATIQCELRSNIHSGEIVYSRLDRAGKSQSKHNSIALGFSIKDKEQNSPVLGIALASGTIGTYIALQVYGVTRLRIIKDSYHCTMQNMVYPQGGVYQPSRDGSIIVLSDAILITGKDPAKIYEMNVLVLS